MEEDRSGLKIFAGKLTVKIPVEGLSIDERKLSILINIMISNEVAN